MMNAKAVFIPPRLRSRVSILARNSLRALGVLVGGAATLHAQPVVAPSLSPPLEFKSGRTAGSLTLSPDLVGVSTTLDEKFGWVANRFRMRKAQRSRFFALTAGWRKGDVVVAWEQGRVTTTEPGPTSVLDELAREFGPEVMNTALLLEQTHLLQPAVDAIALDSLRTETPLTVSQASRLFADIYERSKNPRQDYDPRSLDAEKLCQQASTYLTGRQVGVLRQWFNAPR